MPRPNPSLSFPSLLDNTTLSTFAKCPRQAFWAHVLHLKPKWTSIHLHAGKAYAELCEKFRIAYYDPASPTYRNQDESLIPAIRAFYKSYGYDEAKEADPEWEKSPKSATRMIECFFAMLDEYPPATDPIQPAIINGKPAVELSFSTPVEFNHPETGDPLLFHGRFDMIADYGGKKFVFDDKTTSQLGPRFNDQWEFRSQFTGYCMGATTFGVEVSGAIVRGHCIAKTQFKFAQPITYRQQFQVDEWWQDIHNLTYQFIDAFNKAKATEPEIGTLATRKYFPALGTFNDSCNAYSGCAYRQLCSASHPQRWLGEYVIKVWNPVEPD